MPSPEKILLFSNNDEISVAEWPYSRPQLTDGVGDDKKRGTGGVFLLLHSAKGQCKNGVYSDLMIS
jgi:hypothetical protein